MLRIIFPPSLLTLFPYTTLFRSLRHFERKLAVSGKDASRRANLVADRDGQRLTPLQRNRAPAFEPAGPNLGAAQILQDGNISVGPLRALADLVKHRRMIAVTAV